MMPERQPLVRENWSIRFLLEDFVGHTAETRPQPRSEIWASDLGKPFVDRWLQMKGVPYSNPATGKDLVVFFLGKQVEEGLAGMLTTCGLAFQSQDKLTVKEPGCLPVVGRPDLVLEVNDWNEVLGSLDKQISEKQHNDKKIALRELVKCWKERYPQGLKKTVFEIKSVKAGAFNPRLRGGQEFSPYTSHKLQLYTYMRGMRLTEGHLIYVDRGYGEMREFVMHPSTLLAEEWLNDVRTMTDYYACDKRPPLEPEIVDGKKNWQIQYSRYRSLLYEKGGEDESKGGSDGTPADPSSGQGWQLGVL